MSMGQWNHSIKAALLGLSLLAFALPGCQKQSAQTGSTEPSEKAGESAEKSANDGATIVGTTNNGAITIDDIRLYHEAVTIPALGATSPAAVNSKTSGVLEAAQWVAATEAAAAAMKDAPTSLTQTANQMIDSRMKDIIDKYLLTSQVLNKLDPVSDEQLNKYYEEHKSEYRQPFAFRMRHLILTTYEPYTLAQGDTLESIAERISGDQSKAALIRADLPGRPLRREEGKEFKPLVEGEKLLVPMDDAKAEGVHQELLKLLDEQKQGKTFEQIAKERSQAGNNGEVSEWMPTGTNEPQILPEILEAAKKTPVGKVSEPFRTRHGWQAIQVVEKQEEGFKPLSVLKPQLVQQMQESQRLKLTDQMFDKLMAQPGVTIHYDRVTSATEPASDTVIAETSGSTVRFEKIRETWQRANKPKQPEDIRRVLQTDPEFAQAIINLWAKGELANPQSELNRVIAKFRTGSLGTIWIRNTAGQQMEKQLTEPAMKKYYEEHKDQFTLPESAKITIMERRLSSEERKLTGVAREDAMKRQIQYMNEDLANCKSAADFGTNAGSTRVLIEGPEPPIGGQSFEVALDQLPTGIRQRVAKLQPGKWTEPFAFDDKSVISICVDERIPAGVRPFTKVADQVRNVIMSSQFEDYVKKAQQEFLKKSGFQSQLAG